MGLKPIDSTSLSEVLMPSAVIANNKSTEAAVDSSVSAGAGITPAVLRPNKVRKPKRNNGTFGNLL